MEAFKGTQLLEFIDKFENNEDCYRYLLEHKWGKGYSCFKCGHTTCIKGKKWYYKRCQKCNYNESATANSLFHKLKFPILKAFHILFKYSTKKKGMSSYEIASEFGINQKTAWAYHQRIQVAMKSTEKHILKGEVDVDEFVVGGPEKGKQGRSDSSKNKIILAVEILPNGKMGQAYAQCIEDYSEKSIRPFMESRIDKNSVIKTDGFSTYKAMKKDFKKLRQYKSDMGKNFPEIHVLIMNFKSWLRGIHHKCEYPYMQRYIDEFFYRFNRRSNRNSIFNNLFERFMNSKPLMISGLRELND